MRTRTGSIVRPPLWRVLFRSERVGFADLASPRLAGWGVCAQAEDQPPGAALERCLLPGAGSPRAERPNLQVIGAERSGLPALPLPVPQMYRHSMILHRNKRRLRRAGHPLEFASACRLAGRTGVPRLTLQ